jgi:hypothetical protein
MGGQTGLFSLRLVNCHIPGLKIKGAYPLEGFVDANEDRLVDYPGDRFYFTHHRFLHTSFLKRSSTGSVLHDTLYRRKYKIELGTQLPTEMCPENYNFPHRSFTYILLATLITPIKYLYRFWLRLISL